MGLIKELANCSGAKYSRRRTTPQAADRPLRLPIQKLRVSQLALCPDTNTHKRAGARLLLHSSGPYVKFQAPESGRGHHLRLAKLQLGIFTVMYCKGHQTRLRLLPACSLRCRPVSLFPNEEGASAARAKNALRSPARDESGPTTFGQVPIQPYPRTP